LICKILSNLMKNFKNMFGNLYKQQTQEGCYIFFAKYKHVWLTFAEVVATNGARMHFVLFNWWKCTWYSIGALLAGSGAADIKDKVVWQKRQLIIRHLLISVNIITACSAYLFTCSINRTPTACINNKRADKLWTMSVNLNVHQFINCNKANKTNVSKNTKHCSFFLQSQLSNKTGMFAVSTGVKVMLNNWILHSTTKQKSSRVSRKMGKTETRQFTAYQLFELKSNSSLCCV